MPILKNLTVRYLRELARKHLGDGHSRLKTRDDLMAALRKVVPGLVPEGEKAAEEKAPVTPRAEVIRFEERSVGAAARPSSKVTEPDVENEDEESGEEPPVEASKGATAVERLVPVVNVWPPASAGASSVEDQTQWAEPVVEGFFVARIAGESELRRHHLIAMQSPQESSDGLREPLPELPQRYDRDRLVLLGRDPRTLVVFWDLREQTRGELRRAELRLLDNGHVVRRVEVPLEAPSWYLEGVSAGRHYRAELWVKEADGTERPLLPASNDLAVPLDDLSADTTVRFMRVSPDVPLLRLRERRREEGPMQGAWTGAVAQGSTPEQRPSGISLEVLRERWEPGANSGSWQLRSWRERVDLSEGMPLPGGEAGPHGGARPSLTERTFPVGGSSSFTLTSSFGLGGGSGSGRGGKS